MHLGEWMLLEGWTDDALAAKLGRDRTHINKLRHGVAEPSMKLAGVIVKLSCGQVAYADLRKGPKRLGQPSKTDRPFGAPFTPPADQD